MQKGNDDSQFFQFKLENSKKFSLYFLYGIFRHRMNLFVTRDPTTNCPLWVTNSVRRKLFILCAFILPKPCIYYLTSSGEISGERQHMPGFYGEHDI